jgi:CDP-4-dehydro-6-deoxyglucose reductase
MRPPLGAFTLRNPAREALWIATGTGIAPFRALAQAHIHPGSPRVTLLFGARVEASLLYHSELQALARRCPAFAYWPTLTRPEPSWTGRVGRVQAHLDEAIAGRGDLDFYLCGLKQMVDDVRLILKGKGVDRKRMFYEKYD